LTGALWPFLLVHVVALFLITYLPWLMMTLPWLIAG
jgi:TRAP-type C4-dicarboxylate transport system permease large subunit